MNNMATWANGKGVFRICGYEGGYSPPSTGATFSASNSTDRFKEASKKNTALSQYTLYNYNNFMTSIDGGNVTAEFPPCFQLSGLVNSSQIGDPWSVLDDIYESNNSQFDAIVNFNTVGVFSRPDGDA